MNVSKLLAFLLTAVVVSSGARAQSQLDPVTIPVVIHGDFVTEADLCDFDPCGAQPRIAEFILSVGDMSITTGDLYGETIPAYSGDPYVDTLSGTANLKPGKNYQLLVDTYFITSYDIRVEPPSGYSVFIDDVERLRYSDTAYQLLDFRIEANMPSPTGQAAEPRPGRIIWSVGMGQLRNGDPAGSIQMRELALTADTFKPGALYYDHSNPDITVLVQNGVLRQVYANECLADIQKDTNPSESDHTFWVRFYARTQVFGENPDGTRVVGSPFVEYKIENPNYPYHDRLRITRFWKIPSARTS